MAPQQKNSVLRQLRAFSYLLVIYGAVVAVVGAAVLFTALTDGGAGETALPLASAVLGAVDLGVGGVTVATGILGRAASLQPERLGSLLTLSVAGVVVTVLGMGLCNAVGNELPTALLLNVVLMVIALVVATNLKKQRP